MLLGTKLRQFTKALGFKTCKNCQERADYMDYLSRRGFLGGVGLAVADIKFKALLGFWSVAGAKADQSDAVMLVRTLNTLAHLYADVQPDFSYPTWNALVEGVILLKGKHNEAVQTDPSLANTKHYKLIQEFNTTSDEVIPGWKIDYAVKPKATDGYLFSLSEIPATPFEIRRVYVTDEIGEILRADQYGTLPPVKNYKTAHDFPGILGNIETVIDRERTTVISRFLQRIGWDTVVYAQGGCLACCSTCIGPGCTKSGSCPPGSNYHCCSSNPVGSGCICYNCGVPPCTWCCFTSCGACCSCFFACYGCDGALCGGGGVQCCNPYCHPPPNCGA